MKKKRKKRREEEAEGNYTVKYSKRRENVMKERKRRNVKRKWKQCNDINVWEMKKYQKRNDYSNEEEEEAYIS